jgi:hypothetical protein
MRRLLITILLVLGLAAAAVPTARALDPDTLRQDLTEALKGGISAYANQSFSFTEVRTTAQGEAVRVEILALALPLPNLGGRLELGDLAFTVADARAEAVERRYRVSEVTAAGEATLVDDAGTNTALVNYRLERLAGVWSAGLRNFLDLDMAITGFEIVVPEENLALGIAEVTAVSRSSTRADGLTDMAGEARAVRLRVINPDFGTLQIAELYADFESHGQDLAGVRAFTEALQTLNDGDAPPDRSALAAIVEDLAKIDILPQGFIERFRLTDLTYLDPAQKPRFHLDQAEVDIVAGELHLPLGYGNLGMKVAGIRAETPGVAPGAETADPLQALVPENLGFIVSVERFPIRLMWQSIMRAIALSAASGEPGSSNDAVGEAMGAEIMAAINEARTILRLDRLDVENPAGRAIGEGVLQADVSVPAGVTGRLDLTITGLDRMISIAMSAGAAEGGGEVFGGNGSVMALMMLKSMARREIAPDGTAIDRFEIALTPAGEERPASEPTKQAVDVVQLQRRAPMLAAPPAQLVEDAPGSPDLHLVGNLDPLQGLQAAVAGFAAERVAAHSRLAADLSHPAPRHGAHLLHEPLGHGLHALLELIDGPSLRSDGVPRLARIERVARVAHGLLGPAERTGNVAQRFGQAAHHLAQRAA